MSQAAKVELPPGVEREPSRSEHHWILVIVSSRRTTREVKRFLAGERKVFRKLDLASPEDVSGVAVMCAVCKLAAQVPDDLFTDCPGEPLPGKGERDAFPHDNQQERADD
jgi:hypothetical protein